MDKVFDDIVNNPTIVKTFIIEGLVFSFTGIITGSILDGLFTRLSKKQTKKHYKLAIAVAQIIASILLMFAMWKMTNNTKFAEHWQSTIPGLTFPAFYFGIQTNIYGTIQSYYL